MRAQRNRYIFGLFFRHQGGAIWLLAVSWALTRVDHIARVAVGLECLLFGGICSRVYCDKKSVCTVVVQRCRLLGCDIMALLMCPALSNQQ